ncbi:MAG: phosphopantothenoylcysteine decarboxylase [Verrucomicrobiaceae bacterium]|nr:phosphopantothenoylcysteine decarboxylase [Verrucomicrobiaceae bacterium]
MRFLITAGPTHEPIDPVRYLTNRSSGKMGYALAAAAREAGHAVTLISGPTNLPQPAGVNFVPVETAKQMFDAVAGVIQAHDVAVFSAAVADYTPAEVSADKIKKSADQFALALEKTADILGSARVQFGFGGFLVGFAAETRNLIAEAQSKLHRKACDLVVANDVSKPGSGFDSDENEVTLCLPGGRSVPLPKMSKTALAARLVKFIDERIAAQNPR